MAVPLRFTFRKEERLCSKKLITGLYNRKDTHRNFRHPLKASWLFTEHPGTYPAQVLFSISKRSFRRAHDRNRLRRLMRESYRLQKNFLYENLLDNNAKCIIAISYIAKEKLTFQQIHDATAQLLQRIQQSAPKPSGHAPDSTAALL